MSLARLELLEVRLGSGKVYLVPRALLVHLVIAYPDESLALIQEVVGGGKGIYYPPGGEDVGHPPPGKNGRFLSDLNRKDTSPSVKPQGALGSLGRGPVAPAYPSPRLLP
jgi:hypothetical protein